MARVVLDANLGVALAIETPDSELVERRMMQWQDEDDELYVPTLWAYEVANALYRMITAKRIQPDQAKAALGFLFSSGVVRMDLGRDLHEAALVWASRMGQGAAYDAHYIALAEHLNGEFWTADRRLVNVARQLGLAWVHHIQEDV